MVSVAIIPVLRDNYIFIFYTAAGDAVVVDPAQSEPVLDFLASHQLNLRYILNTHHHADHVGGNRKLKERTGCQVIAGAADKARIPVIDQTVNDGDVLSLCGTEFHVLFVPGHTHGHVAYYAPEEKRLFCGDTLFSLGCGRLFEGDATQLYASLKRLAALPGETLLYCAHEYTYINGRFALTLEPKNNQLVRYMEWVNNQRDLNKPTLPVTLESERRMNPFLRCDSLEIRRSLGMIKSDNISIFTEMRLRKDHFI